MSLWLCSYRDIAWHLPCLLLPSAETHSAYLFGPSHLLQLLPPSSDSSSLKVHGAVNMLHGYFTITKASH
ncbi:hypothetical protein HBI57_046790 [Parastagonospora nodorum]|nr:hypothetical protein HBI57_046790 [Parastagonospora nodorum]